MQATNLKTNHLTASLGIDGGPLFLSWQCSGGLRQTAYEIHLTADDALSFGIAERVISEEGLGTAAFYKKLADEVSKEIEILENTEDLIERRYQRFRSFGRFNEGN